MSKPTFPIKPKAVKAMKQNELLLGVSFLFPIIYFGPLLLFFSLLASVKNT